MAWKKFIGIAASGALVGVVAFGSNGCSSSKTSNGGSVTDGSVVDVVHHDSSSSSGSSGGSGGGSDSGDDGGDSGASYDGTTGKACTTDADCHPAGGPGVNICSNDDTIFQAGALFPSPVCFMPSKCDPGTDGGIHFCDGPDDPSSPGVCLPTTTPAQTGMGICLPQCNFKPDGSAVTGCVGKDQCDIYGIGSDSSGNPLGIGYCYNGCDTDADCTAASSKGAQHCQADEGICVAAVTVDLPQGTGCNSNATPAPACNCIANTSTGLGYCGQYCKVGGTECTAGWICDVQLPTELTNAQDAEVPGWTSNNPGMAGFCAPSCMGDAGHTQLDSGTCPSDSTCQTGDVGGPDCLP